MYTVYQHKNMINNKSYFGITSRIPEQRWGINGDKYISSPHFYNAIQKYGWDNFDHIILFENLTKEDACLKEQELISEYNTMDRDACQT
ncbi:MAG: GIY-YIG nuclease family protein [Clostridia bacterium]|nr:GIY-YIG nuclease family protein [Lachnospiraceae bacterium]NCB99054.1 GIY-YIG nuclease family protein [Clostridia bacterium]NCD03512.1 GIY-YIG nuclease family protein [Clostridia bacterium]